MVGTEKCHSVYKYEVSKAGCRFAETTVYSFDFNCEKIDVRSIP